MKVSFYTLGCKVNQSETGAMQQLFFENGFSIVENADAADIYIVNSCTVTSGGDKKSRQWLRRCKRDNPSAVTVLTGCYPQAFPIEAEDVTEADIITGSRSRARLVSNVLQFLKDGKRIVDVVAHQSGDKFEELPMENFTVRTRAFMKIEDGCNRKCAYCIIPKARGEVRSRSLDSIRTELVALVAAGYKEVVLSGINLTCYGTDNGSSLAEAVELAASVDGIERIRLGSTEPDLLTDDILLRLSKVNKLCCQFHMSLQSGCDKTLKAMNRLYTPLEYAQTVAKIRSLFNSPTFTTDVIVGFPDETDEDFEQSVAFVTSLDLLKVHVFSYSPRSGTPAAEMEMQVPDNVKSARSKAMTLACNKMREAVLEEFVGTADDVLLEKPISADTFTGYTSRYLPVVIKARDNKQGDIVHAEITGTDNGRCIASIYA